MNNKKCPLLAVHTVRMKEEGKKINESSSQSVSQSSEDDDDASCSVPKIPNNAEKASLDDNKP